jgi:CRP/FNR family transcriptional regulator
VTCPENDMLSTATTTALAARPLPVFPNAGDGDADRAAARTIGATLELLGSQLQPQRQLLHAGDTIYQAGDRFQMLYVVNAGFVKIVNLAADGREQVAGLKFRGDWLGFDGIADGRYTCDAVAMDTTEVWSFRYDALLAACAREPRLLHVLHEAMSREIARDRDSMMSMCTLPADARVAGFLRFWVESLAKRGLRTDQITLRMTRAEIGNYLGMTLETVSRALSRLARDRIIGFAGNGRRHIVVNDAGALAGAASRTLVPAAMMQ